VRALAGLSLAMMVAGCSGKPAPYTDLGITLRPVSGEHCTLSVGSRALGDPADYRTKEALKALLPHPPFSTGIHVVGAVPSACVQQVYEVLRTVHVSSAGILTDPSGHSAVIP
jgi:hypothetical protein